MQEHNREAERRGCRRHLGKKQRTRTHGQRRQHKNVTAVRERGIPTEHGEQSDNQHGGGDQKMLGTPGHELLQLRLHGAGADNQGRTR